MKSIYNTKEEIPEGLGEHYKQREDGRWVLDVEGLVPAADVAELRTRLNEFRTNNVELAQKLKGFEGKKFLTQEEQDEYEEMRKQAQEIQDKNLIDAGKIDELLAQRTERMRADYDNKISAYEKRSKKAEELVGSYKGQLSNVLVEAEVSKTLSALGVQPVKGALSDIIARARGTWTVNEKGNLVALDANGNPLYGQDPSQPMSMSEWAGTVTKEAPYLFMENKGSGGDGGKGGDGGGSDNVIQIPRSNEAMKSRHIADIASGKAVIVDD